MFFLIIAIVGFALAGAIMMHRQRFPSDADEIAAARQAAVDDAVSKSNNGKPDYNPRIVIARPFKAIQNAKFITADQVKDQVTDQELVLGVVINGEAKAYPINMLCGPSREIINDTLGDQPIAATW
jgi:hypothetical protein